MISFKLVLYDGPRISSLTSLFSFSQVSTASITSGSFSPHRLCTCLKHSNLFNVVGQRSDVQDRKIGITFNHKYLSYSLNDDAFNYRLGICAQMLHVLSFILIFSVIPNRSVLQSQMGLLLRPKSNTQRRVSWKGKFIYILRSSGSDSSDQSHVNGQLYGIWTQTQTIAASIIYYTHSV